MKSGYSIAMSGRERSVDSEEFARFGRQRGIDFPFASQNCRQIALLDQCGQVRLL